VETTSSRAIGDSILHCLRDYISGDHLFQANRRHHITLFMGYISGDHLFQGNRRHYISHYTQPGGRRIMSKPIYDGGEMLVPGNTI
jgi:hypothetical protein